MPARPLIEKALQPPADPSVPGWAVVDYLSRCRVRNRIVEAENDTHVPPTAEEARSLLKYLRQKGVNATIVGSVGVLHHLKASAGQFRPTVDLDLFVPITQVALRKVAPPADWSVDRASPGVVSWISPSGGYVDFLTAGHIFPSGGKTPRQVQADPAAGEDFPVAHPVELFRLKLDSMRAKDLSDLLELAKAVGGVPSDAALGKLTATQRENVDLLRRWYNLR